MTRARVGKNETVQVRLAEHIIRGASTAGSSKTTAEQELARLDRWLTDRDCSLATMRERSPSTEQKPVFPATAFLSYQADRLTDHVKPSSVTGSMHALIHGLKAAQWDVHALTPLVRRNGASFVLGASATADLPEDDIRNTIARARPLMLNDLETQLSTLDNGLGTLATWPLWLLRMRAFILIGFVAGLRISELVRLEHSWFTSGQIDGSRILQLTIPSSKQQPKPRTVIIPTGLRHCPIDALEHWTAAKRAAGLPDDGRVFLEVARDQRGSRDVPFGTAKLPVYWTDHIAQQLADTTFHPASSEDQRRARAVSNTATLNTRHWRWLSDAAGFTARTVFERISSHAFRRGCATELSQAGVSLIQIAVHLRHTNFASSCIYIEAGELRIADPFDRAKAWTETDRAAVAHALVDLQTGLAKHQPPG